MSLQELQSAVQAGDKDRSLALARELLDRGTGALKIIESLTRLMGEVGEKFSRLEIFLPEMMMAGAAMSAVVELLAPRLKEQKSGGSKGKIILGTVMGDLHEIGKNIVKLMLETQFFEVKDLGVNVDPLNFIREAEGLAADVIGASSLMTTTMPHQKEIVNLLQEKGLRGKYKVVVGGAPVNQKWAEEIGADLYCPEAGSAPQMIGDLLGARYAQ
jgi:corrinoid protein of di/trimethylamine methyltransferase